MSEIIELLKPIVTEILAEYEAQNNAIKTDIPLDISKNSSICYPRKVI